MIVIEFSFAGSNKFQVLCQIKGIDILQMAFSRQELFYK